jgi:hypothetical protein
MYITEIRNIIYLPQLNNDNVHVDVFHNNVNTDFHLPASGLQIWETEYWAHHVVSRHWGRETRKVQSTLLTTENQIRIIRNCKHHIQHQLKQIIILT